MIDTFYWDMRNFFGEKLITEVLKSKHMSVCNVADSFYAVFPHAKFNGEQCGIVVSTNDMKRMVENPSYFQRWYSYLTPEQKEKSCFSMGKSNIELVRQWKAQTQLNGPDASIDVEFEQQLGVRQGQLRNGRRLV